MPFCFQTFLLEPRTSPRRFVDAKTNENLVRGAKNLATSQWLAPEGLNVYDILRHDTLVLTQDAAKAVVAALKGAE